MSWIFVALLAYFFLAIANIGDKFLVDNVLKSSKAYAFVVCFMGLLVFIASPWLLSWPGFSLFAFNLINGALFAIALWFLYEALIKGEASRVLVLIGGLTPIFSLIFSLILFKEKFHLIQIFAVSAILFGVFLIAFLPQKRSLFKRVLFYLGVGNNNNNASAIRVAILSAFFYSLYFIGTKIAYSYQSFASSFLWTRLGAFLFVLLFLFNKDARTVIFNILKNKKNKKRKGFFVVLNQIIGSLGFILQNYAIFLGSVFLVNALQGFQYALILVISASLSFLWPKILKEEFSLKIVFQKSLAVVLIAFGIFLLTL